MLIEFEYGLDAPPVVRNMGLISGGLLILAALGAAGILPNYVTGIALWPGISFGCGVAAMMWSSKIGKIRRRDQLLNLLVWRGDEAVLDIGCGRGLMLIGAAKRVPAGHATGVDIWQAEDLSGNSPDATIANARREDVVDRVDVQTADIRALPFADDSFDTIVSSTVIHNIYEKAGRAKAISEIARVLKPGGQLLVDDIRYLPQYMDVLRGHGWQDLRSAGSAMHSLAWTVMSWGSLRPGTLLATKPQTAM